MGLENLMYSAKVQNNCDTGQFHWLSRCQLRNFDASSQYWTLATHHKGYRQTRGMRRTKSQDLNVSRLVLQLSLPNHWIQVWSREWRWSWSSADRRCSNYIWEISNFIAYKSAVCIRGLTLSKQKRGIKWTKTRTWMSYSIRCFLCDIVINSFSI